MYLWACETISGLKQGYRIVSWDNELVFEDINLMRNVIIFFA